MTLAWALAACVALPAGAQQAPLPLKRPAQPTKAEITAGRVPLSGNQLEMPRILARYVVGAATARELHWVRSC